MGQLPKWLQRLNTENVVAPWVGLRNTMETNRVFFVKNNMKWLQNSSCQTQCCCSVATKSD